MAIDVNATDIQIADYTIDRDVLSYIHQASTETGIGFDYMLAKAAQESSFKPSAQAKTSSATGIFQFTKHTWFEQMYLYGPKYGYRTLAAKILKKGDGSYVVSDKKSEERILALRKNPQLSALMAAEFAKTNRMLLSDYLGRNPKPTDLYLAHFLGLNGAMTLLDALQENPLQKASSIFPSASQSNPRIFYQGKRARSVKEVYQLVDRLFNRTIRQFSNLPADFLAKVPDAILTEPVSKIAERIVVARPQPIFVPSVPSTAINLDEDDAFALLDQVLTQAQVYTVTEDVMSLSYHETDAPYLTSTDLSSIPLSTPDDSNPALHYTARVTPSTSVQR